MLEAVDNFIVIITKPKDVFQWNSEWKCSVRVRLLNNILLSNFKTCVILKMSCCASIFEPKLVEADRYLKFISWVFEKSEHGRGLSMVKNTFYFLTTQLIFYVAEKMHKPVIGEWNYVLVCVSSVVGGFHQLPIENKITFTRLCEQDLRFKN